MGKKVVIFAAGGTIAMRFDEKLGGLVPAVTGKELAEAVPELKDLCQIDVIEFSLEPSSRITPEIMLKLAADIEETLKNDDIAGVVVTHGTDTLEETAYFLDLYISSNKPVCVTGAMRSGSELSPDGGRNILDAVRVACSQDTIGIGVTVIMNEEIHSATDVVKSHSANLKTFLSPFWGYLGYADTDKIIIKRKPLNRINIKPEKADSLVPLIKIYTGMDNDIFDFLLEKGCNGLVIEAFGRGNMSKTHVPAIKKFLEKGIPVVLTTRTSGGRVLDAYAYEGGAKQLQEMGVIMAGEITAAKARLKLIMALGVTKNIEKIKSFFD